MKKRLTGQEKQREMTRISRINEQFHKDTESRAKDHVFNNWILARYTKHLHEFKFSDRFVWTGAVYTLPGIFGYIVFFTIFLFLAHLSFNRYGDARTIVFFILLAIWRLNVMVKFLAKINKKIK